MLIHRSRIFDLHSTSVSSRQLPLEYLQHPGTCAVLILNSNEEVGLVAHHRPAIGRTFFELPSRVMTEGSPETALVEEIQQETKLSLSPKQLQRLSSLYSAPGYSTERVVIFLARTQTTSDILRWFTLTELNELIQTEQIVDLKTVAAITSYQSLDWGRKHAEA